MLDFAHRLTALYNDMTLTQKHKKQLRNRAHTLKPVVIIGQHGLSDNVNNEINLALDHHELIKVRVNAEDKRARTSLIDTILENSQAELIQQIGHIAVFYRHNPEKSKRRS